MTCIGPDYGSQDARRYCSRCHRPMSKGRLAGHVRHHGRGICAPCCMKPREATRTPGRLGRRGDVDEVAVQRAIDGVRMVLTTDERESAVAELTRQGFSGRDIADRLGVWPRTVCRIRARLRAAA